MSGQAADAVRVRLNGRYRPIPYQYALALIILIGGLLRLAFLGRQPLWRDEAFTAIVAQHAPADVLGIVSRDSAPPLFYLLEHFTAAVSGSPWSLRLISALAGTALIPLVASLARRIHGEAAGLWAAGFVALLPASVAMSRDARGYALGAMLVGAATVLLWRAVERPAIGRWIAYALAVAAAFWTVYFAVMADVALLVAAALCLRPPLRTIGAALLASLVAMLSLIPWLAYARAQFDHVGVPFWVQSPTPPLLAGSLVQFWSGPLIDSEIPFRYLLLALQGLAILCGGVAFLILWSRRDRLSRTGRRGAVFCFWAGTLGLVGLLVAGLWRPVFEARYAAILWVLLYALAGTGLALAPRRIAALLLIGLAVPSLVLGIPLTRADTDRLLPAIESRLGDGDLLDAYPSQYLSLLYEGSPRLRAHLHVVSQDVPWFWGTAAYPDGAILPADPQSVIDRSGQILYVSEAGDPAPSIPTNYVAVEQVCAVRVCLTVYRPAR